LNHRIYIEGDPQEAVAEDGEILLDALLRNGVGFAYSCQAGNCGSCKYIHVAGEIDELTYSEHALSADERARDMRLACRSRVLSDLRLRRLIAEAFVMHPARSLACRLVEKSWLTHDVLKLRFTIEAGGPFTFSAGQFAKLQFAFAPDAPRDYSMANAPGEADLQFHVRVTSTGVSGQLRDQLEPGHRVQISGPFGTSYLREQQLAPIIAIAGGTGLGPIRSIVRRALDVRMPGPIHVYVGVREERDVYGEAELLTWAARTPALKVHVVLAEGAGAVTDRRAGLVTDAVVADFDDLAGFRAYLAGPPAMVEAAVDLLRERGVATHDIHADAFYGAAPSQPVKGTAD
jgi:naphthalene 1,2-dioxygenase ferredoxin reductase component